MRTGLTKQEKTTDIWFDEKDPLIHIRTHNTNLKKRLAAYPFVYLRKPNTLLRKLFIFHKFYIRYTGGDTHSHLPL